MALREQGSPSFDAVNDSVLGRSRTADLDDWSEGDDDDHDDETVVAGSASRSPMTAPAPAESGNAKQCASVSLGDSAAWAANYSKTASTSASASAAASAFASSPLFTTGRDRRRKQLLLRAAASLRRGGGGPGATKLCCHPSSNRVRGCCLAGRCLFTKFVRSHVQCCRDEECEACAELKHALERLERRREDGEQMEAEDINEIANSMEVESAEGQDTDLIDYDDDL